MTAITNCPLCKSNKLFHSVKEASSVDNEVRFDNPYDVLDSVHTGHLEVIYDYGYFCVNQQCANSEYERGSNGPPFKVENEEVFLA